MISTINRYSQSFAKFVTATDEKNVIANFLIANTPIRSGTRVLDIGAGMGEIAFMLRQAGAKVTAVEPNPLFIKALQAKNIRVLEKPWEEAVISGHYDVILACHVMSHFQKGNFTLAVQKMLDAMKPEGQLWIVTVDQSSGSWRAVHEWFYQRNAVQRAKTSDQVRQWKFPGETETFTLVTQVKTDTVEEMEALLQFDFLDYPEAFKKSKSELHSKLMSYVTSGDVALEVVHQIIRVKKKNSLFQPQGAL